MGLAPAERMRLWREMKKKKKRNKNKNYYNQSKQKNTTEVEKKKRIRLQTAVRVKRYRQKALYESSVSISNVENAFDNRMAKSRAVKRTKYAMPNTPNKKTAVLATLLKTNSPSVTALQQMNLVVSPDEAGDRVLGQALLEDIADVIKSVKNKRNDDVRATLNVITASSSGENIHRKRKATSLAKAIGLPARRIFGGMRVRAKIFASEKSCWTYIERKTRNDSTSESNKMTAYNFWLDPSNSRPSGNKCDVKRVRLGPKIYSKHAVYILETSQTEVFTSFQREYPQIKLSQRTFERLKPYFIRAARPKDRITCCCRHHVEARSLFKTCMDFRKKYTCAETNTATNGQQQYPIYEHLTDIASATLCPKHKDACYLKHCLDRQCKTCGVDKIEFSKCETDISADAPNVKWERYEYITVGNKKKLTLIKKETKPGEMFQYFKHLLEQFPSHQFRAQWQNTQFKCLKENLPNNHCIVVHDYSENYQCKDKVEIQTSYFQRTEVSIHVSVIHRHAILEVDGIDSSAEKPHIITEHFFIISPDDKHDQYFTHTVQMQIKEYLRSIGYDIEVMHEFTDGCACQYKSRHCFGIMSNICKELDYEVFVRNYYETSHAKGPLDAAGGFLKNQLDLAVLRNNAHIQSAMDVFKYCNTYLTGTKSESCKRRIFRYTDSIDRSSLQCYKPITGIRKIHQVVASKSQPGKLLARHVSCYACDNCLTGKMCKCTNVAIGSELHTLLPLQPVNDDQQNDMQECPANPKSLINAGTIIALYTDEGTDYYLLKAQRECELLKGDETDDWGVSYRMGANILRGHYFNRSNTQLSFLLIKNKVALVPVASIVYIFSDLACNKQGVLRMPESHHLDILKAVDEISEQTCL